MSYDWGGYANQAPGETGYFLHVGYFTPQGTYVTNAQAAYFSSNVPTNFNVYQPQIVAPPPTPPVYNPPAPAIEQTSGAKPMSYYGYGSYSYSNYTPPPQQVSSYTPPYAGPQDYSPLAQTPTLPGYVYSSPNIEQTSSTAYVQPQQVYIGPSDLPNFNPTGDYSGLTATPDIGYGSGATPLDAGGGGPNPFSNKKPPPQSSGGGSSGGGGQQPQQKQQGQQPIVINNILSRSGSGMPGGNTGALYNPNTQGYGGQAGSQYGSGGAGYNAPSIVPYLLLGGLGLLAYNMLGKKHAS